MLGHRPIRPTAYATRLLVAFVVVCSTVSCRQMPAERPVEPAAASAATPVPACQSDACRKERDEIYSLLAYAVVFKDWQPQQDHGTPVERGHNIGSVLVDPGGNVVFWARNSNAITDDASQHGEVRLIRSYLVNTADTKYLDGYTIYTTLEPCAMCSGMMALTKVSRAVYGQTDPAYGRAIERLMLDSRALKDAAGERPLGYPPYPRGFKSEFAGTAIATALDARFLAAGDPDITKWLRSDAARGLFEQATATLLAYQPSHAENVAALRAATRLYASVPDDYVAFDFNGAP